MLEVLPIGKHHPRPEVDDGKELAKKAGNGAVHQGVVLEVEPLDQPALEDILDEKPRLLMLDQVTDPHNVGAILRTAAAFGVGGVIVPKNHAPEEGGAMAKSACGALDMVPMIEVTNLVAAMEEIKPHGYWLIGLDGDGDVTVREAGLDATSCLVLGAEGAGLRRLTRDHCDRLVRIPMDARMESLNVSNATAIALYEAFGAH
jgi:23S rRNA (guanosine2251-2'-O)-methyltransferase